MGAYETGRFIIGDKLPPLPSLYSQTAARAEEKRREELEFAARILRLPVPDEDFPPAASNTRSNFLTQ